VFYKLNIKFVNTTKKRTVKKLSFFIVSLNLNYGVGATVSVDVAIVSVVVATVSVVVVTVSVLIESVAVVVSPSVLLLPHDVRAKPATINADKITFFIKIGFISVIG
jgi:hypothetical protein